MGFCPDYYPLFKAAKYLGVAPYDLAKQSVWWRDKALIAMSAENEAQKILNERR
jgi:hypothetical protein